MKKRGKAIYKVTGAVKKAANEAGELISSPIWISGTGLYDALDLAGRRAGIRSVFNWLGSVLKGIADLTGSSIKGAFNIIGGLIAGVTGTSGGIITMNAGLMFQGLIDIFSPMAGTLIVIAGRTLSLLQSFLLIQGFERRLHAEETGHLKKVFGKSLRYSRIRIIEGRAGLFGLNDRAFTLGNTIYTKSDSPRTGLLVHECTHVWQFRHLGVTYSSDALGAQWLLKDAYNWEVELNSRGKKDWKEFNMESQAEFLQELWKSGEKKDSSGISRKGNGAFYEVDWVTETGIFRKSGKNFTVTAQNALSDLRKG